LACYQGILRSAELNSKCRVVTKDQKNSKYHGKLGDFPRLGKGNYGEVYHFKDSQKNSFALKFIDVSDESNREFAYREVEILYKLNEIPGVSHIHDCELNGSSLYLLIDMFYKHFLEKEVKDEVSDMSFDKVLSIIRNLANTLESIHQNEVIHSDVKPENIMFTTDKLDETAFIDFGVAKYTNETRKSGTPLYVSPELLFTKKFDELKNETWGFGIAVCVFLFGEEFYRRKGYKAIHNHLNINPDIKNKVEHFTNIIRDNLGHFFEKSKDKWAEKCGNNSYQKLLDAFLEIFKEQSSRISLPGFISEIDKAIDSCSSIQGRADLLAKKEIKAINNQNSQNGGETRNPEPKQEKAVTKAPGSPGAVKRLPANCGCSIYLI
jgi:serine/threonine protein kinase